MNHGRYAFKDVEWCDDIYSAASDADIIVVLTEWNEFRGLDFLKLKSVVRGAVIMDFRNLYSPEDVARAGFDYHSLGRASFKGIGSES
jgi:UDPglucose 6-dehydrogenase